MASPPNYPASETETGERWQASPGLRAALARMPSETCLMWALTVLNLGWIAGLVAFRLLK